MQLRAGNRQDHHSFHLNTPHSHHFLLHSEVQETSQGLKCTQDRGSYEHSNDQTSHLAGGSIYSSEEKAIEFDIWCSLAQLYSSYC